MVKEIVELKTEWNIYKVQDTDRPMHVVAKSWHEALDCWQVLIRKENPNVDWIDGEDQPLGIELVAVESDCLYPIECLPPDQKSTSKRVVDYYVPDEITADHMADLYASAYEEGENSRNKLITELRQQITQLQQRYSQLQQVSRLKIDPKRMTNLINEICDWLTKQGIDLNQGAHDFRVGICTAYEAGYNDARNLYPVSN